MSKLNTIILNEYLDMNEKNKKDIDFQLEDLSNLKDNWYDCDPLIITNKINPSLINYIREFLHKFVDITDANKLYLYPSYESGISVEWDYKEYSINLLFSPNCKILEFSIDSDNLDIYYKIDLDDNALERTIQLYDKFLEEIDV